MIKEERRYAMVRRVYVCSQPHYRFSVHIAQQQCTPHDAHDAHRAAARLRRSEPVRSLTFFLSSLPTFILRHLAVTLKRRLFFHFGTRYRNKKRHCRFIRKNSCDHVLWRVALPAWRAFILFHYFIKQRPSYKAVKGIYLKTWRVLYFVRGYASPRWFLCC